jgi:CRISPR/Cas system CSM-associated protein Csm5 (group 7 of RAMP superfamily)
MAMIIDEEEYKLIDALKDLKLSYKESSDNFKHTKAEIVIHKHNLDVLKVKFVEAFETWFFRKYGIKIEDHELKLEKVRMNNFRANME